VNRYVLLLQVSEKEYLSLKPQTAVRMYVKKVVDLIQVFEH